MTNTRYHIRYYGVGTKPESGYATNLGAVSTVTMVATTRRISSIESVGRY